MYRTPDRIVNSITMQRSQYRGAFLVVEGDTDRRFYQNFVNRAECQIVIAHDKEKAINVMGILDQANFVGVLAIIDADFWVLEGRELSCPNLFMTDTHDLETMILKSPALEKFLAEYGSPEKIKGFETQHGAIREFLLSNGIHIGYLRWLSLIDGLALKFEELSFSKFLDEKTLVVSIEKFIKTVKNHSQKAQLVEKDIQHKMDKLKNNHAPWYVCCGHDLINILSVGLHKIWGSHSSKEIEPETIEKNLRLAYEYAYFLETQLCQAIKNWETTHNFKILLTQ